MAGRLLAEAGEASLPVNLERLAAHLGVVISRSAFKDGDVSGMLVRQDDQPPWWASTTPTQPFGNGSPSLMNWGISCCTRGVKLFLIVLSEST